MNIGKFLILSGLALALAGVALTYAPWLFSWFGRLPGDIRIEGENRFILIPITSMIVISLILSLIVNLWLRR